MENEYGQDFSKRTWKEDLALITEGKELYVAKNVLAYLSPVFEAMFSHPFSEKDQKEIELPGKQYDSFLEFLSCFYPGSEQRITENNLFQVIPLADEYQVDKLLGECKEFMCQYVKEQNRTVQELLKCLAVSERHHMKKIKQICVDIIEGRQPAEIADAEIDPICKDAVFEIMKRILVRQQVEKVKLLIHGGQYKENYGSEFDGYTDAKGAVIDFTAENVSAMEITASPVVDFWGIVFSAMVKYLNRPRDNKLCLVIFFQMRPRHSVSDWSCRVKARFSLKNSLTDGRTRFLDHTFKPNENALVFNNFAEMSEVLDPSKGYIKDDKVQISIAFLANKPDMVQVSTES